MCAMVFEFQGKTENYVRLKKDGGGVKFLGTRNLVEYDIQLEKLYVRSKHNISQAVVKIVFRRRMEYHVQSTFFQVCVQGDTSGCYPGFADTCILVSGAHGKTELLF